MIVPKVEKLMNEMETSMESGMETGIETGMESKMNVVEKTAKMKYEQDGIFVDLECFMNNIQTLKNHSNGMMIDLSLLLSNVKSCSYVKKTKKNIKSDLDSQTPEQIVNKITSKIEMPTPDVVKLQTMKSTITVPSSELTSHGQVLGIIKEPFETESDNKKNDWDSYDFIKIVILVIILALLIFRK